MAHDPALATRASYAHFRTETLRFSDTDMVGHINNVAFAALFETGRTYFGIEAGMPTPPAGTQFVLARVEIDYLGELHWPGSVDIGTKLLSIGRSSYVMGSAMFTATRCVAISRAVLVMIDRAQRSPTPFPPDYRTALQGLIG